MYEKMKKDMTEEKQKLESDYRNNEEVQNLIQQNTEMKEQNAELEDRHWRNNLRFMGIKVKSGVESETWVESETKVKEKGKRKTIIAKFLNYKQREKVLNKYKELKLWED